MKPKTEKPETYSLSKKEFTQFAKAVVSVPKKEVDKQLAKHNSHTRPKKKST